MSVTITEILQAGAPNRWKVTYSSSLATPTFYIYLNGEYLQSTEQTTAYITVMESQYNQVDVFDSPSDSPSEVYPGRVAIQWPRDTNAVQYKIEEYVDAAWTERQRVLNNNLGGVLTWRSRFLEDDTEHQFRVTPLDRFGQSGPAYEQTVHMVRRPDDYPVTLGYDAVTGKITVSTASAASSGETGYGGA